jgi:hypothetical protein
MLHLKKHNAHILVMYQKSFFLLKLKSIKRFIKYFYNHPNAVTVLHISQNNWTCFKIIFVELGPMF